jgi:Na+/proline symporter
MLAARDESGAVKATLWFNIAHYAVRPWPWIIVALASLLVYPDLESLRVAFPNVDPSIVRNDLAYPAMLVFLPAGLLGVVVASLAAAYMSTISTHLNWGASYIVDDFYRRFAAPDRSEGHYVRVGRLSTFALIVMASGVAVWLENAMQAFQILLQIGAGTGLVFLLRWFWWRINAWSEISAMVVSFAVAVYFEFFHVALGFSPLDPSTRLVVGVAITTLGWLVVTLLTPPAGEETLRSFYRDIRPLGPGWGPVIGGRPELEALARETSEGESITAAVGGWVLGLVAVYGALFGTGYLLYGSALAGMISLAVAAVAMLGVFRLLPRVGLGR